MTALHTFALAGALVACSTPAVSPPEVTIPPRTIDRVEEYSPAARAAPSVDAHPGTIHFIDPDGSEHTDSVADVPEGIAWVDAGEMWEPVVRVEAVAVDGVLHSITSYGVDGLFLERVTAPPPRR